MNYTEFKNQQAAPAPETRKSEMAVRLLEKIAACSKGKSKKKGTSQDVKAITIPNDLKKSAALLIAGHMQKQAGALSDAANGFMKGLTDLPKDIGGFVQRNAPELGGAAGKALLAGTGFGSAAYVLAKILKAKNPGTIGMTTGAIAGALQGASDVQGIRGRDKAKRWIDELNKAFTKPRYIPTYFCVRGDN